MSVPKGSQPIMVQLAPSTVSTIFLPQGQGPPEVTTGRGGAIAHQTYCCCAFFARALIVLLGSIFPTSGPLCWLRYNNRRQYKYPFCQHVSRVVVGVCVCVNGCHPFSPRCANYSFSVVSVSFSLQINEMKTRCVSDGK